jgi:hypothetical protein
MRIGRFSSQTKLVSAGQGEASGRSPVHVSGSGGGFDGDLVSEGLQLTDEVAPASLGVVAPVEEVRAEVLVVTFVVQEVPDDDQDGVSDSEGGLGLALLPEPAVQLAVERSEVAAGTRDRPG